MNRLGVKVFRISYTVKAAHGRDDYHVAPSAKEGTCGTQAELFYLVVNGEVLFDVGIGRRQIGLRLIIIVVGHEILDGIGRKEGLEFSVELCGQRLVVA